MTVDTLLLETLRKLVMLTQAERIGLVPMVGDVVMAIPTGIYWKIGSRIAGNRIRSGRFWPAMTGSCSFRQVDLCLDAVGITKIVDVGPGGAMAVKTDDSR